MRAGFATEGVVDGRLLSVIEVADDRKVSAKVVRIRSDRQPGAFRFLAEHPAKPVDVGTAFASGTVEVIRLAHLGTVFTIRRAAEIDEVLHTFSFRAANAADFSGDLKVNR